MAVKCVCEFWLFDRLCTGSAQRVMSAAIVIKQNVMKADGVWHGYQGGRGSGHVQKFVFGRKEGPRGGKWEWKHHQEGKGPEKEEQR
jgi:hypothetical protein